MQLIIDATTVEELMAKVCEIANKFGVDLSENTRTPVTQEVVEAAKTVEVEVEEAPKKEKKAKKVDVVADRRNGIMATAVTERTEAIEEKTFTKQDIASACQKVSEVKGLEIAREILATFGAKRISEVKEVDYAAFVVACSGCLEG